MKRINKVSKIFIMLVFTIISTGCMKYDTTMEINKDKSMNLTIITAVDQNLADQMADTTNKSEIESKGFYVEEYNEDGKTGYKVTKQIKNIDDVSTEASLSKEDMTDALNGDKEYMFTIKKGFFKNTYKAVYDFSSYNMEDYDELMEEDEYDETCLYNKLERGYSIHCSSEPVPNQEANRQAYEDMLAYDRQQSEQYKNMYEKMDLKFRLKLPYKAIKSNATSKSNLGKTLEWDLTKVEEVSFEFPIYNMTRIYIAIGIGILVIMFFTATLFSKRKRTPKPKVLNETNIGETKGFISQMGEGDTNMNNQNLNEPTITSTEEIQQGNRFIEYEEEVKQQPVENKPTINEIYDNIPVVGVVGQNQPVAPQPVIPEPVAPVQPVVEPQVAPQPIVPDVAPVQPVVEPQVAPQPIVPDVAPVQPVVEPQVAPQPIVPDVAPVQPVMPEQPVIDLGIPDMIPTPSDNNQ